MNTQICAHVEDYLIDRIKVITAWRSEEEDRPVLFADVAGEMLKLGLQVFESNNARWNFRKH